MAYLLGCRHLFLLFVALFPFEWLWNANHLENVSCCYNIVGRGCSTCYSLYLLLATLGINYNTQCLALGQLCCIILLQFYWNSISLLSPLLHWAKPAIDSYIPVRVQLKVMWADHCNSELQHYAHRTSVQLRQSNMLRTLWYSPIQLCRQHSWRGGFCYQNLMRSPSEEMLYNGQNESH